MTGKEKILSVLGDRNWHSFRELLAVYYKFTQRIFDLRREGFIIEERKNNTNKHAMDYRIIHEPSRLEKEAIQLNLC